MTQEQGTPRDELSSRDGSSRSAPSHPVPPHSASSGYDWGDRKVPGPFGAPAHFFDDLSGPGEGDGSGYSSDGDNDAPRRGLPAWAIVAIVAVQAVALVLSVGLVVGGIQRVLAPEPGPSADPSAAPTTAAPRTPPTTPTERPEKTPGTVTDAEGNEVGGGIGSFDRPATVGEHAVGWEVWTGGDLEVTALSVDFDGEIPDAGDVIQDGYRLVVVEYEARYRGGGQLAPAEELWLTGESDRTYFIDVAEGLLPDPMIQVAPLADGETARFHSAFLVPEAELDSFRLGVETYSGAILYLEVP